MKIKSSNHVHVLCLGIILLVMAIPACTQGSGANAPTGGAAAQASDASPIAGEWQGAVGRAHLAVKIEQTQGAALKGSLTSVDQGNVTVPFDSVAFDPSGAVRFDLKAAGAFYEGKLSADGSEIAGTWHQGGSSIALVFRRPGTSAAKFTLKPRVQGKVALQPCRTSDGNMEALCGKYEVFENRQSQQGRKITLNILLLPSKSDKPEPDPFFAFAGGPGQAATEAFPGAGYLTKVQEHRDVVLVDQRGTGGSNVLQCDIKSGSDAQSMIGEYFSPEKVRQCHDELEKKADLTQYTTSIAADDVDEVRQAMGYEKINAFGGSYGTKAGLVYLRRHGDHVRTLTLEAVASPEYRIPVPFARTIQSSVDRVIARCAADPACHKDFPNLRQEFNTLLDRLQKAPAHFEVQHQPVTLSRWVFVANLRRPLYVPEVASQFPYMIHSAFQGDWSTYGLIVMTLNKEVERNLARGLGFAVICSEDLDGLSENRIRRETAGTYLGDEQVRLYQKACQGWERATLPKDFYAPLHSQVPTLLISGELDPATPPEMARQAAHDLTNSRLVAIKEGTHGTGSPCIDGLIAQFVQQGSAAGLDASCTDQIHLPPFLTEERIQQLRQQASSDNKN